MYSVWLKMSDKHGDSVQNVRQKSTTKKNILSILKRINAISNVQYFVKNIFRLLLNAADMEWMHTHLEYIH